MEKVEVIRPESEELQLEMEQAWKEVREVRNARRKRYAVASGFTALGVFLLFLSLFILLEGIAIVGLGSFWTFLVTIFIGSISFGYGFYRMGVS